MEHEGREAYDDSKIISVDGTLSIVGGCESEDVTFEEAVGRAGLFSENSLDTAGLPVCEFSEISKTINFLLGFQTGQLIRPLS